MLLRGELMGMPVKLSDALVEDARAEANATSRSITAQIEHWARLGRSMEKVLPHDDALAIKNSGGDLKAAFPDAAHRERVATLLRELVDGMDRRELSRKITAGRTVYQMDPNGSGSIERLEPDGQRTLGRMENRRFIPNADATRARSR
jgi:hypothetical protein